jgi:gluconolactonase
VNKVHAAGIIEGEGPVFGSDGSLFCVEMATDSACVKRIDRSGHSSVAFVPGGRPNGMTIDGNDRLWVAEARSGSVICYTQSGQELLRIRGSRDGRFLWPNDLRFGPNGLLYLTDSGIIDTVFMSGLNIRPDWRTAPYQGRVYEIDPTDGSIVRSFGSDIKFTNGLAFDASGVLYVAETLTGQIHRLDPGDRSPRLLPFGNVVIPHETGEWRGPDGIAFGEDGVLYCTVYNQQDIVGLDREGRIASRISTLGKKPTNLAFSRESPSAYITEVSLSHVEIAEMPTMGLPLHRPSFDLAARPVE